MEIQIITIVGSIAGSIIGGTVGAYLGAYLKKRGEFKAIKDKFDEIKDQLTETTKITHKIQGEISQNFWIDQQRWELRRDLYLGLIENLNEAKLTMREIYYAYFMESWEQTELWNKADNKEEFVTIMNKRNNKANQKIKELLETSGILFLSNDAKNVVNTYLNSEKTRLKLLEEQRKKGKVHPEYQDTYDEYMESQAKAVNNAYDKIVETAKADLQIKNKITK